MRYLLALLLLISVSATAQYSPTAAKTRFVNGIGLGTKDTATMNAADTVAMIIGRDSLVYFKYKGYWKALAYNSSLTGYVPYTGATSSVNLGAYNLTATKIAIGGSISAVALDVHRAGSIVARIENTNSSQDALFAYAQSAQNVWFTGIDYASGANNFGFYYSPDGTTVTRKAYFSLSGDLTANSFIKSGGTSAQFLKADGSVTTTIPSGSIDTGRAATAIATGGSLNKVRDSLQANIGLKLNISDTATMLSSYYNKTATDSRLALKVNYTDTSTMLSPYQRAYNAVKYTDTASMLTGYKTYYPRAALSAGTGISYNNTTGVITNSSPSTGGTVTSVATNTGSGITGGTITTSGTIAADTSVLSTKANVTALLLSKVSSVSGTSPIVSSGGTTPAISIPVATTSVNGYLSSTDWNTFNGKQAALTNPVTGTGTTNYLPKFTGTSTIGNSAITDDGTTVTLVSRALSGTSATFSSSVTALSITTSAYSYLYGLRISGNDVGNTIYQATGALGISTGSSAITFAPSLTTALTLASTGAATFSSSVLTNDSYNVNVAGGIGGYTGFKLRYGTASVQSLTMGQATAGNGAWIGMAQYRAGGYWQTEGTAAAVLQFESDGTFKINTNSGLTANTDYNVTPRLTISNTGAATFSSTLRATNLSLGTATTTYPINVEDATQSNSYFTLFNTIGTAGATAGLRFGIANGTLTTGGATEIVARGLTAADAAMDFKVMYNYALVTALTLGSNGAATFSSTLGINGVADNVKSGSYAPTITASVNVTSASNTGNAIYTRVGNVVTVSGMCSISNTAAGATIITISLPVASSLTNGAGDANGTGAYYTGGAHGVAQVYSGSGVVVLSYTALGVNSPNVSYQFTYLIN